MGKDIKKTNRIILFFIMGMVMIGPILIFANDFEIRMIDGIIASVAILSVLILGVCYLIKCTETMTGLFQMIGIFTSGYYLSFTLFSIGNLGNAYSNWFLPTTFLLACILLFIGFVMVNKVNQMGLIGISLLVIVELVVLLVGTIVFFSVESPYYVKGNFTAFAYIALFISYAIELGIASLIRNTFVKKGE